VLSAGIEPVIVVESARGLNPDYLKRLIQDRPHTYLTGTAFTELARKLDHRRVPASDGTFRFIVTAVLLIGLGLLAGTLLGGDAAGVSLRHVNWKARPSPNPEKAMRWLIAILLLALAASLAVPACQSLLPEASVTDAVVESRQGSPGNAPFGGGSCPV
jgi:hypothetical protein